MLIRKTFKDDRPTIILKEIGNLESDIQMPSVSGDAFKNIDFSNMNDSETMMKIHSLLLDSI